MNIWRIIGLLALLSIVQVVCSVQRVYITVDKQVKRDSYLGDVVAFVEFNDTLSLNGWTKLNIKTNGSYSNEDQAHSAGMGEGWVTADRILQSWVNTMSSYCKEPTEFCNKLKEYVFGNLYWMKYMVGKHGNECSYWHHVGLIQQQIQGLYDGFNMVYPNRLQLDDFYLMNFSGDLEDLEEALKDGLLEQRARKRTKVEGEHMLGSGSCSAIIKWTGSDLLTSHITWNSYQSMIRIIKNYDFSFRDGSKENSDIMPGRRQVFTSYPGIINSGDDYSLISSGLLTMETTIGNSNTSLWQYVQPMDSVPEFMRNTLANRLAKTGKEWADIFTKYNSGTYNNQWMVVDYNKFTPNSAELPDDLLWVLEQIPGHVVSADQTDVLRKQKYWPSYNTPFYPEIFKLSGCQESVDKYGPMFAYSTTPRALIFKRDQAKVVDLKTLYELMRYNDYKNDPLSACECTPPYTAENSIAARSDLNPADGTYLLPFLGHRLHGATDYKGTNYLMVKKLGMMAAAGPTAEQQPPFRWSTSDWKDSSHIGMNDLMHFEEMYVEFEDEKIPEF